MAATRYRPSLDVIELGVLEDALHYYLSMSADNFGSGYEGEDRDAVTQMLEERGIVSTWLDRFTEARQRMGG